MKLLWPDLSLMPWREPTAEEARVVTRRAVREAVFSVLGLSGMIALFSQIIARDYARNGNSGPASTTSGIFAFLITLLGLLIIGEIVTFINIKRKEYIVLDGYCMDKWGCSRGGFYLLKVDCREGISIQVPTSFSSYRHTRIGSKIIVVYSPNRKLLTKGLWAFLN